MSNSMPNKAIACHACGDNLVIVDGGYKERYCCSGAANQCGCMGAPTNPVFCEDCEKKLFNQT